MNAKTTASNPEVSRFINRVRGEFVDLSVEERDDLLGGLEADLHELVAEHGAGALGDPVEYAAELRAASGLNPVDPYAARQSGRRSWTETLDNSRDAWTRLMESTGPTRWLWQLMVSLRPVWWVWRAWAAAMWFAVVTDLNYQNGLLLPFGTDFPGLLAMSGLVLASVMIGRKKLWPGQGTPASRTVLAILNTAGVPLSLLALGALVLDAEAAAPFNRDYGDSSYQEGLINGGYEICNIHAFDAQGNPLYGVQLFDQDGQPLEAGCEEDGPIVGAEREAMWGLREGHDAWVTEGGAQKWNVYPYARITKDGSLKWEGIGVADPGTVISPVGVTVPPADKAAPTKQKDSPNQPGR